MWYLKKIKYWSYAVDIISQYLLTHKLVLTTLFDYKVPESVKIVYIKQLLIQN